MVQYVPIGEAEEDVKSKEDVREKLLDEAFDCNELFSLYVEALKRYRRYVSRENILNAIDTFTKVRSNKKDQLSRMSHEADTKKMMIKDRLESIEKVLRKQGCIDIDVEREFESLLPDTTSFSGAPSSKNRSNTPTTSQKLHKDFINAVDFAKEHAYGKLDQLAAEIIQNIEEGNYRAEDEDAVISFLEKAREDMERSARMRTVKKNIIQAWKEAVKNPMTVDQYI